MGRNRYKDEILEDEELEEEEEIEEDDELEEREAEYLGPGGGAFTSWSDYYRYKEG